MSEENSYEPKQIKPFSFDMMVKIDVWALRSLHLCDQRWGKDISISNVYFITLYIVLQVQGGAKSGHTVNINKPKPINKPKRLRRILSNSDC